MSLAPIDPSLPGEDPPATHKRCGKCGRERHLTDFPRNARMKGGLSSWCRWCHREATRRWRTKRRKAA
jgi:hypothetical protein